MIHFRLYHSQNGVAFPACLYSQTRVQGITSDNRRDVNCRVCKRIMEHYK